ncbi:response regulator [Synechococcus elongatus]|uniref:Response regulator receiver modulated diguanylate cyclase n=1 Tax=Synechococcus elongatus (strain ATCC 33912 / PCC 7942 / FACHB-805) TaxID=1140 RepID=Q31RY6_SYNE7|nr:response regulator [Synechococcus elongatus]ABB56183.1 response regulator receiver modulated diguanylate cyclase [Synechococcus elongatus PCC 7942 = FACHB-805]AJD56764.1 chemotaxis protein CheY [Synechococcus elongatus UTEX 2973]MBD2588015.1 response regulator [Synechococcus elongatus FACHB-242]MBD2689083.1 response regulator [Synechococcus elongatus FACHB-1061]MBD2707277.1 response regulator [Synechococcus elongatus PCC 7942 = FACHB-805]
MVCALLVENNEQLPAGWRKALTTEGIALKVVPSLPIGIKSLQSANADLIFINGLQSASDTTQFCQQLRQSEPGLKARNDLPIVLITAPGDYDPAIALLDSGADEVWLQSMPVTEFVTRLRAVVRRLRTLQSDQFRRGNFILQPRSRQASFDGINLNLRPEEYDLLELLLSSPDRVFSESILLRMIWPQSVAPNPLQLSEIVTELNYKLAVAGSPESLELLYGLGWHWRSQPKTLDNHAAQSIDDAPQIPNRQAIWQRYRHEYWQRLDAIAITLSGWEQIPAIERTEAYRHAQTLAGALGSFGFEKESQNARILAAGLHSLELETEANPTTLESLLAQVQQLRVLLGASDALPPVRSLTPLAPASAINGRRLRNQIEVWSRDRQWAEEVATKANLRGLGATIRLDLDSAADSLDSQAIDLLILEVAPEQLEDPLLVDLVQSQPHLPILLVSDSSLPSRIQAARLGSQRFFHKFVSAEVILDQAFTFLEPQVTPDTVLIADDDPALLTYLQQLLQPWGWQLTVCKRGEQFWEILESSQPDLIILDADLPGYNGFELCRALRSDRYWINQPILILAERYDSELVQQALRYGADDVITKPIASSELVARIYNRLEKYRQLQRLAAADNLTGLVNQRRAREVLSLLLGLAQRYRQPLTLAVIQLSPPPEGEAIAPGVHRQQLIQLAARLQRSCRREDVVARWTDEQFVLGFYGVGWSIAIQRIEQVKLLLQQSREASAELVGQAPIRISAGIAEFPIHGTDLSSLTTAAIDVLSRALEKGGDRIVVAEGRSFSTVNEDLLS